MESRRKQLRLDRWFVSGKLSGASRDKIIEVDLISPQPQFISEGEEENASTVSDPPRLVDSGGRVNGEDEISSPNNQGPLPEELTFTEPNEDSVSVASSEATSSSHLSDEDSVYTKFGKF